MIKDIIFWSSLFLSLFFLQYSLCEFYLIKRKKLRIIGYILFIFFEISSIVLSCYLIVFIEYLQSL